MAASPPTDWDAAGLLADLGQALWSVGLPLFDNLRFSPAITEITGYQADEFSERRGLFRSLIPCEDHPLLDDAFRRATRDGRASASFRLRRADGSLRRVRGEGVVRRDRDGRPCLLLGTLTDVTADDGVGPDPHSGEGFYHTIVDDIREAIVRLGPDLTITYCNREFAALCRSTPQDVRGRLLLDVVQPELRDAAAAMLAALTPTAPTAVQEFERTGPDGLNLCIRWSVRAIVNEAGEITEYQGVGHDISDIKRLQQALAENHDRLSLAIRSSGAGLYDVTVYPLEDGSIDFLRSRHEPWVSPSWKALFGYADDEMEGTLEEFSKRANPEDLERLLAKMKAFTANPVGICHDVSRFRHRDGRTVYLETCFTAGKPRIPGTLRIVGALIDVTDLKRAEQRLQDAIETMEEGFIVVDGDMRIIEVNHRFREMYDISGHLAQPGASYVEFLRHGALNGQYARGIGCGQAYFEQIMQSYGENDVIHKEVPLANGRWLLVSQRRTADGGWVGIRADLTAQKAREAELEQAGDRLTDQARDLADLARRYEEANQTKSRFLAHMSHELRTPLNAILGFTELMRTLLETGSTDRIRDYCNLVHQGGSHLLALINDILDLSRVESGRYEFVREPIDLDTLLGECLNLVNAESGDRNIAVETTVAPDCRTIGSDSRALKQITVNLLSNALKFTPDGGRVRVSWRRRPDCAAEFQVQDTGIGMTEDDIEIALDPFGQIDSAIARGHQGTGLGLPLVKALTEALGGHLTLASVPGQGTTATILLPAAPDGYAAAERPANTAAS